MSNEQHGALAIANEFRHERAVLKRRLAAGDMHLSVALSSPYAQGMVVLDLVRALPGYGRPRAIKRLKRVGISSYTKACDLTNRQHFELVEQIEASSGNRVTGCVSAPSRPNERKQCPERQCSG